ncbi:unnamed protein product [Cunninghamella blakesleeana]
MIFFHTFYLFIIYSILQFTFVQGSIRVMSTNTTHLSQSSMFGPKIDKYGLLGYLYEPKVEKNTGCHVLKKEELPIEKDWIALIKRGGCSFYTKVNAMQQSGAIAVIIGDEINDTWLTMTTDGDSSHISIPSVFLPKSEYFSLILAKQNLIHPILVLLNNEDKLQWTSDSYFYGIILFIPMLLLGLVTMYLNYKQHQAHSLFLLSSYDPILISTTNTTNTNTTSLVATHSTTMTTGMDLKELNHCLPKQKITKPTNEDDECTICLDQLQFNDDIRILPCKHTFHVNCIDDWLTSYKTQCPYCNYDVFSDKKDSMLNHIYLTV